MSYYSLMFLLIAKVSTREAITYIMFFTSNLFIIHLRNSTLSCCYNVKSFHCDHATLISVNDGFQLFHTN